jgi:hypothetical protein
MKTTYALICISFGLFLGAPQGKATASYCTALPGNLLSNCGFEAGTFTGWTLAGNDVPGEQDNLYGVEGQDPLDSISPNSGNDQVFIADLVNNATTLSQTLATVAGVQYTVSLFLAQDTKPGTGAVPNSNELIIAFGGVTLATVTGIPIQGYTQYSYTSVASSASSVLAITIGNDLGQSLLDDVSVVGAVPEPSTWGLMAGGLICFLGRKRFGRRA